MPSATPLPFAQYHLRSQWMAHLADEMVHLLLSSAGGVALFAISEDDGCRSMA